MRTSLWKKVCQAHGKDCIKSCAPSVLLNFILFSYVRVRYEDLVSEEHTEEILKELYDFMGIPFSLQSQNGKFGSLLQGETSRVIDPNEAKRGYYGLSRDNDFNPNHWTKELNIEVK